MLTLIGQLGFLCMKMEYPKKKVYRSIRQSYSNRWWSTGRYQHTIGEGKDQRFKCPSREGSLRQREAVLKELQWILKCPHLWLSVKKLSQWGHPQIKAVHQNPHTIPMESVCILLTCCRVSLSPHCDHFWQITISVGIWGSIEGPPGLLPSVLNSLL